MISRERNVCRITHVDRVLDIYTFRMLFDIFPSMATFQARIYRSPRRWQRERDEKIGERISLQEYKPTRDKGKGNEKRREEKWIGDKIRNAE